MVFVVTFFSLLAHSRLSFVSSWDHKWDVATTQVLRFQISDTAFALILYRAPSAVYSLFILVYFKRFSSALMDGMNANFRSYISTACCPVIDTVDVFDLLIVHVFRRQMQYATKHNVKTESPTAITP
jgi:hypothetical protein